MRISEKSEKIKKVRSVLMNNQFFFVRLPLWKISKSQKMSNISFWWMLYFLMRHFLLKEYNVFTQITKRSLDQKNGTLQFWKVNNPIATKLGVILLKNRRKLKLVLVHDTIQWLNFVGHYLNVKKTENWLRKLMHNFVVHSNESACNKSGRLGLDQVLKWWSSYRSSE